MPNRIHLAFIDLKLLEGSLEDFTDLAYKAIGAQFGDISCFGDKEIKIMFSDGLLEVYVDM